MASIGKTSVKQFNFGESKVNSVHIMSPCFLLLFLCRIATCNIVRLPVPPYAVYIRLILQPRDGMRPYIFKGSLPFH